MRALSLFLLPYLVSVPAALGSGCHAMDSLLSALELRHGRVLGAETGRNSMEAESMRLALGSTSISGSGQAFLAGTDGLRMETAIDSRPWRLSAGAASYAGGPAEFRLALGRDLLDDTRPRMGRIDSLREIRDRMARLRFSALILGRLKEVLALRLRRRRHLDEMDVRMRIADWAATFGADMGRIRDGGFLSAKVANDLHLTLVENEELARNAWRLGELDALTAASSLGVGARALDAIDLDWLAARLEGEAIPASYQDELDSLALEERRILLHYQGPGRKRLSVGPAVHILAGEPPDWGRVGVQIEVGYEFGKRILSPALPGGPERTGAWSIWSSLRDSASASGLENKLDSAVFRAAKLAALEPTAGYAALNELIRKKISAAISALEFQEALGMHLVKALERISQLRERECR